MTIQTNQTLLQDVSDTLIDKDTTIANLQNTIVLCEDQLSVANQTITVLEQQIADLTPPPIERIVPELGIFTGGALSNNPEPIAGRVQHFEEWVGKPSKYFIEFAAHTSWAEARSSLAFLDKWKPICNVATNKVLVMAWPLAVSNRAGAIGFNDVVTGNTDVQLAGLVDSLVNRGMTNTIFRLGHEMNGDWYPWGAANDSLGYIAAFRYIVKYIRNRAPTAQFKFCWNPSITTQKIAFTDCYPGNFYVDLIGMDIYDMWWGDPNIFTQAERFERALNDPHSLNDIALFARLAGKPLVFPEWGTGRKWDMNSTPKLYGGGTENPEWIEFMHDFMTNKKNNVKWQCFWNRDAGSGYESQIFPTDLRPVTAAKYKELFGA